MVIYEVNLDVDAAVADELMAWLALHVEEMLRFDGFEGATLYTRRPEEESAERGRVLLTVHYRVASRGALERYLLEHAASMRREGLERFPEAFRADRRILYAAPRAG